MIKIFLDPGHGGHDPGAVGNGLQEKHVVLDIAKRIEAKLKQYENVQVKMSRTTDVFVPLSQRAKMANDWKADYFCSIHLNSAVNKLANGFETFIYNGIISNATIANQNVVHAEITKLVDLVDRGKKRANFLVIRETKCPAILTENGFISNAVDANKLKQDKFLDAIAQGHVNGFVKAFGLKKKKGANNVSKDQTVSDWAKDAQKWVVENNISDGKRPKDNVTREEVWTMLHRAAGSPKV